MEEPIAPIEDIVDAFPESIYAHVSDILGVAKDDTEFKIDILTYISGALATVNQLGAGKSVLLTEETKWNDVVDMSQDNTYFQFVILYVLLRVKTVFDPPAASALTSLNALIDEYAWRISVAYSTEKKGGN